jgi:hypothetical protein
VEPVSLTVGAVVAALVLKGAEKTGEKVSEGGLAAIGRRVDRVRARFRHRKDAEAERALARVEDPPAGPTQLAALAAAVDRHAGEDTDEPRCLVRPRFGFRSRGMPLCCPRRSHPCRKVGPLRPVAVANALGVSQRAVVATVAINAASAQE